MAYEVSDTLKWMGRRMNDAEVSGVGVVGLCVNPAVFAGCGKPGKICGQSKGLSMDVSAVSHGRQAGFSTNPQRTWEQEGVSGH